MPDNVPVKTGTGAVVATDERLIGGELVHVQIMAPQSVKTLVDDVGGGVTYVGEANPGTATYTNTWRIRQITEVGADVSVLWADGNDNFDNIWDNRASLVYS